MQQIIIRIFRTTKWQGFAIMLNLPQPAGAEVCMLPTYLGVNLSESRVVPLAIESRDL